MVMTLGLVPGTAWCGLLWSYLENSTHARDRQAHLTYPLTPATYLTLSHDVWLQDVAAASILLELALIQVHSLPRSLVVQSH